MEVAYNGQQQVKKCGMKHGPESKREPQGKGEGSRPSSSPRRNSLEREDPTGKTSSLKENQPTCFASFWLSDCPDGNARDYWHPPWCPLHHKGNCKFGSKCAFKHAEKAGGEPKKRNDSVLDAKTLDHATTGRVTVLNFRAEGDLLHGVSAIPAKSILQVIGNWLASQNDL